MARFYFHIFDDDLTEDYEGQFALNLAGAEEIAKNSARELVCDQIRRGYLSLDNYIVVANEDGQEVLRVAFREAFEFKRKVPSQIP